MEWTRRAAKNLNWPDLRLTSSGSCMIACPGAYNIIAFVLKYAEYALCFVVLCIFSLAEKHEFLAVKSTIQEFLKILNYIPKRPTYSLKLIKYHLSIVFILLLAI